MNVTDSQMYIPHRCLYSHCCMKIKWFWGRVCLETQCFLPPMPPFQDSNTCFYISSRLDESSQKDFHMSPCRTWWTRMLFSMPKTWRSPTRLRSERLHVEKQELRRKPARTGEKACRSLASLSLSRNLELSVNAYKSLFMSFKIGHRPPPSCNYYNCWLCVVVSRWSTCGLAEELEQESKATQKATQPKSACGNVSVWIRHRSPFTVFFDSLHTQ